MNSDRIEIILTDTQDAANIGSVCRAMKTMGLCHLTLVSQCRYDEQRVKTLALHAFDIYENRKEFVTLDQAIKDSSLAIAATRRHGKSRKLSCISSEELAQYINHMPDGKISIVFGCESSGLTDKQVKMCSMVVTIPTSDLFPSLNLSQAVQIICYELYTKMRKYPTTGNAVSLERASKAADFCAQSLEAIDYYKLDDEKTFTKEFLKDIISRATMTEGEVSRLEKIFKKTTAIATHRNVQNPEQQNRQ